jgi:hypothetical protein
MIFARLCRVKPNARVASRHNVGFCSESRNRNVVQHVFGRHCQLDVLTDRNVQLVDFALSRAVLKFPHPLFSDHVNFGRVCRRAKLIIKNHRAAQENRHRDNERNNRPKSFERNRAVNFRARSVFLFFTIFDEEKNNRQNDADCKKRADANQIKI